MLKLPLVVWLSFTGIFAALTNYSYFYMQAKLQKFVGFQPKLLKYPADLKNAYVRYGALTRTGQAPAWPAKVFLVSIFAMCFSILYLLLAPHPFG